MVNCNKCGSKYGNKESGYCRDCNPPTIIRKGSELARKGKSNRLPTYQFNDMEKRHYVYIVECEDETLYTGITRNLAKRMEEHKNGEGAKYTQEHGFAGLVYFETVPDKTTAENREREIKDKGPKYRHMLIAQFEEDTELLLED